MSTYLVVVNFQSHVLYYVDIVDICSVSLRCKRARAKFLSNLRSHKGGIIYTRFLEIMWCIKNRRGVAE